MASLKIVALIGTPVYLNYFVNRVAEDHTLQMVIRENVRANLLKKVKEKGIFNSIKIIVKHLISKKKKEADYNRIFGNQWQQIIDNIPYFETENINSPKVIELLQKLQPDVVIVQGTTLIKNKTIQQIPLVLNLHWGLSPYYKGSLCTEWAIINNDIHNIGYTIHKIASKIDGGDIYTQGRPILENEDAAHSINMKLTKDGTIAMSKTLKTIQANGNITFVSQDATLGNLYLVKDWTGLEQSKLKKAESNMPKTIQDSNTAQYPIIKNGVG